MTKSCTWGASCRSGRRSPLSVFYNEECCVGEDSWISVRTFRFLLFLFPPLLLLCFPVSLRYEKELTERMSLSQPPPPPVSLPRLTRRFVLVFLRLSSLLLFTAVCPSRSVPPAPTARWRHRPSTLQEGEENCRNPLFSRFFLSVSLSLIFSILPFPLIPASRLADRELHSPFFPFLLFLSTSFLLRTLSKLSAL